MKRKNIDIYVGCSLTQAPQKFRRDVEDLKESLRRKGWRVADFVGLSGGTSAEECRAVYTHDIKRFVSECDLLVAICDFPALGLGYEMGTAIEKRGIPVLAVAHEKSHVTRLVLGIDHPRYTFRRYRSLSEVPVMVEEKVRQTFGSPQAVFHRTRSRSKSTKK